MSEKKGEIPCVFYLYIHSKLAERSLGKLISKKEAIKFLHEWRLPKSIRYIILKELEILGLVEECDKFTIRLNCPSEDLTNINLLYEKVGLLSFED